MGINGFKYKAEFIIEPYKKGTAVCIDVLYVCDPAKNTECKKTGCGKDCTMTKRVEFAKKFAIDE